MKAIIQRVSRASVEVEGKTFASIEEGFLILLGVQNGDTEEAAELLASKTAELRIFRDENDKMNLSIKDIRGQALVISNFTLCADTKKGTRPSFSNAMEPVGAQKLYECYVRELKANGIKKVETGEFGGEMKVSLVNNGPVTITLDTDIWLKKQRRY